MDLDKISFLFIAFSILVLAISLISLAVVSVTNKIKYQRRTIQIIKGEINKKELQKALKNKKSSTSKFAKKLKNNFITSLFKEYIFFKGSPIKFFAGLLLGYSLFMLIFYLLSKDVLLSVILALAYFNYFYVFIDKKNEKHRTAYIKHFSMSLKTITASVEAGNSFETALDSLTKRDHLNFKIKEEFAILSNNLKSNMPLDEALERFWKRNSMFPEFAMFVIIMQFFSKKGGSNLGEVLLGLEETLDKKISNYSEIETELGINKMLMDGLTYLIPIALVIIPLFMPTFFVKLTSSGSMGYIKALGFVALYLFGVIFFKRMVRNTAEG